MLIDSFDLFLCESMDLKMLFVDLRDFDDDFMMIKMLLLLICCCCVDIHHRWY